MTRWTIQKLLNWIHQYLTDKGIESPRLNAELLLSHVLDLKRIDLYTNYSNSVNKDNLDRLHELVKRAAQHEPVAYLIGKTEFYSLELEVAPDCLIPRPETELLVEKAIDFLRSRNNTQLVCDLCTGSGCIAVAIAKNFSDADIVATDISAGALDIAAKNIKRHNLENQVRLLQGDLFEAIDVKPEIKQFDLIVSNPPYVSIAEFDTLEENVKRYEPKSALAGGKDGLDISRRIIQKANEFLKPDGILILEIGYNQGKAARQLLESVHTFAEIVIEKDFQQHERVAIGKKFLSL